MCCIEFLNNSENPAHLRKMLNIRTSPYNIRLSTEAKTLNAHFVTRKTFAISDLPWGMSYQQTLEQSVILIFWSTNLNRFISSNLICLHRLLLCLQTLTFNLMFYSSIFFIELCINSAIDCMLFVNGLYKF